MLIQSRSFLDKSYGLADNTAKSIFEEAQDYGLNEDVVCTYVSLDSLIDLCAMPLGQFKTIRLLMAGYTVADISEMQNVHRKTVWEQLNLAVNRIVAQNNIRWAETNARARKYNNNQ